MAGRKPIPTTLKLVTGKKGRGINENEPQLEIKIPSCPSCLSAAAKAEWRRVAPILENQGLLAEVDRSALAAYCVLYARWTKALRNIEEQGEVVTSAKGVLQTSPWILIAKSAEKEMRTYAGLFGMSPADRSKVSAIQKQETKSQGKDRFFK